MSYDLHLVRPKPGEDPIEIAQAMLADDEEDGIDPGPVSSTAEQRKQRLVGALQKLNPELEPFQFGYAEIAQTHGITEAEARERFRHIELNGREDGNGIQITIHDNKADLTVPYWHSGAAANAAWKEIWSYLGVLEREGEFVVYDPQLDRILDLGRDFDAVASQYGAVVQSMSAENVTDTPSSKPWWKFW